MRFVSSLSFFCAKDGLAESERFYGGTLGLDVAFRTPTAVLFRVTDTAFFGITAGPGRGVSPKKGRRSSRGGECR
jgi:catechol 2,3-dioxygenase-like lactoylglutathione lyase family enzyme